ncbi:hypothetical protein E2C01_072506 [Portunus trituberculatus]|uniref:Uncharacterized protein n=1 Tax=Portunus trituberculatus TaxID=210409 RepID=A0A5B7I6W4_PORTR|nr:hypothetical protein [Portunus trituberculatus]
MTRTKADRQPSFIKVPCLKFCYLDVEPSVTRDSQHRK